MLLRVMYTVSVSVMVDTDSKRVTQVIVHDDCAEPEDLSDVSTETGQKVADSDLAECAKEIARSADWPVWEFP